MWFFRLFFSCPCQRYDSKMVLEGTLQMELETFEQSGMSYFTIDSWWTACLPFASLDLQITAREIALMLLLQCDFVAPEITLQKYSSELLFQNLWKVSLGKESWRDTFTWLNLMYSTYLPLLLASPSTFILQALSQ